MATAYPAALDSLTNPTAGDPMNSVTVPHATQHANLNDAMEAVQATLGVSPQGSSSTVSARIAALEGGSGASFAVVALANSGDGTIDNTTKVLSETASFTLSSQKSIPFSISAALSVAGITPQATLTVTAQLRSGGATIQSKNTVSYYDTTPTDLLTQQLALSGVFASVSAGTYTLRVTVSISTGSGSRDSIDGYVIY
jgi:hypothetical protein